MMGIFTPPLSMDMILCRVDRTMYYGKEVTQFMLDNGYTDIGWRNNVNTVLPQDMQFVEVFRNYTGTYTIYANHANKIMYHVDMGD